MSVFSTRNEKDQRLFNNRMSAFFSDTSFARFSQLKIAKQKVLESLQEKSEELENQSKIKLHASVARETTERWNEIKKESFRHHTFQQQLFEKSATIIQKYVRGFLSRLHIEAEVLFLRETRTSFLIQTCENIANVCLFHLGLDLDDYACTIQAATRRFLFKLKLDRMMLCYQAYIEEKHKAASDEIRKFLLKYACREKVQDILFLKYREKRLEEIKEKLAILRLKRFWKKRKLSFRILKDKILRIKRKKTALANKEAYQKLLSNSLGRKDRNYGRSLTKTTTIDYDDDEEDENQENLEEKRRQQEELERREKEKEESDRIFKEKVDTSLIAYGIKEQKEKLMIPYLQERELNDNISNSLEVRLYETTDSIYKKSERVTRIALPKIRNTVISSSPTAHHKRFPSGSCNLPPLAVLPSSYTSMSSPKPLPSEIAMPDRLHKRPCRHSTKRASMSYQPNPEHRHYHLENQFMQKTTLAMNLKRSEKKQGNNTKPWKMGRRHSEYTPGIDNSGFTPKQWQPTKLDKSILETQFSTSYVRSHRKVGSNPTSIVSFSSAVMGKKPRFSIGFFSNSPSTHDGSSDYIPYDNQATS